ncbi:MAG: alpha/beta hydrolase [Anaerolineales bacterium]|nr:alpha/beta hydrolase [Anaerolineales bacterium]
MLGWPAIVPSDFLCPALWIAGSEDRHTAASVMEYQQALDGSLVQVYVIEGLDHEEAYTEIDKVFPILLAFTE